MKPVLILIFFITWAQSSEAVFGINEQVIKVGTVEIAKENQSETDYQKIKESDLTDEQAKAIKSYLLKDKYKNRRYLIEMKRNIGEHTLFVLGEESADDAEIFLVYSNSDKMIIGWFVGWHGG